MDTQSGLRPKVMPTEADIEAWNSLTRDQQLELVRHDLDEAVSGDHFPLDFEELKREVLQSKNNG